MRETITRWSLAKDYEWDDEAFTETHDYLIF